MAAAAAAMAGAAAGSAAAYAAYGFSYQANTPAAPSSHVSPVTSGTIASNGSGTKKGTGLTSSSFAAKYNGNSASDVD